MYLSLIKHWSVRIEELFYKLFFILWLINVLIFYNNFLLTAIDDALFFMKNDFWENPNNVNNPNNSNNNNNNDGGINYNVEDDYKKLTKDLNVREDKRIYYTPRGTRIENNTHLGDWGLYKFRCYETAYNYFKPESYLNRFGNMVECYAKAYSDAVFF